MASATVPYAQYPHPNTGANDINENSLETIVHKIGNKLK